MGNIANKLMELGIVDDANLAQSAEEYLEERELYKYWDLLTLEERKEYYSLPDEDIKIFDFEKGEYIKNWCDMTEEEKEDVTFFKAYPNVDYDKFYELLQRNHLGQLSTTELGKFLRLKEKYQN